MKRVFVVDDEKLVRQGIITTFPWSKYGFTVVGEAASGEKAIEQLKTQTVDLLVTDLTMPGITGFDLIRWMREHKPETTLVVLTCHDSFKHIQEALRLGVADYIVKTEIVDEMIEDTLLRIAATMERQSLEGSDETASGNISVVPVQNEARAGQQGVRPYSRYAADGLLVCGRQPERTLMQLLEHGLPGLRAETLHEIDRQTWFVPLEAKDTAEARIAQLRMELESQAWVLVWVKDVGQEMDEALAARLRRYRWRGLFYAYGTDASANRVDGAAAAAGVGEGVAAAAGLGEEELAGVGGPADVVVMAYELERLTDKGEGKAAAYSGQDSWSEPGWIYDEALFEQQLLELQAYKVDPNELKSLFYNSVMEWDRLLGLGAMGRLVEETDRFLFWQDWEQWIRGFRREVKNRMRRNSTATIHDAVLKAIAFVRAADDFSLNEADVARHVNMSRGYFSTCFKKVTGQSFGEYVKLLKLERAKQLIVGTDESITRIAEKCGFRDYRYFSRVFRENIGMLPIEFRKNGGERAR